MTTREEVVERRRGATVKEIRRVQEICRAAVNSYYGKSALQYVAPFVEKEDLVQDCLIGWLEGKDIYRTLQMKARSLMPLNNVTYNKGEEQQVSFVEFDERSFERDNDVYTKLIAKEYLDKLDSRTRFIMEAYYVVGMTDPEIGDILDLTKARINQLRAKGLQTMRGE